MAKPLKKFELPQSHMAFWLIGSITVSWSKLEYLLEATLSGLLTGQKARSEILANLGNDTKTEVLFKILTAKERDKNFVSFCDALKKSLLVCRDNRNFVCHGVVHYVGDGFIEIERLTKNHATRKVYHLPYIDLINIHKDLENVAAGLGFILVNNLSIRKAEGIAKRGPLPNIPFQLRRFAETLQPVRRVRKFRPLPS